MKRILLGFAVAMLAAEGAMAAGYDVTEKSVAQLQADMTAGRVTSAEIVKAYLARIDAVDRSGPTLNSVIAVNPDAVKAAEAADAARKAGKAKGPLFGIPVLVKDNIETADPMATTAGSLALKDNVTGRDAPFIAQLRAQGAIILGKTNLSEWANIRSSHSISGWSAVGGLVKNPNVLDRNACGSSSGSGAAVAASLGAVAIGTETDGSLVCPGSINGVVSFKPTVGLVSRTHVVPISHSQDTPGPMGRSVADVAALLNGMAGSDAADPATKEADAKKTDYLKAIKSASLRGLRVGVFHKDSDPPDDEDALFAKTVAALKKAGAVVVPVTMPEIPFDKAGALELMVLLTELKADMNAYLATTPAAVKTRSLADVIAFNDATRRETALFGQELFHAAELAKGLDDADYKMAHGDLLRMAKDEGLDAIFARDKLDVLVMATDGPSWRIDLIKGDNSSGSASFLPAVAGYPHLTVPMGYVRGLPVGLSFIGEAWDDAKVLRAGAAFEKATKARVAPAYVPSLESAPDAAAAFAPVNR